MINIPTNTNNESDNKKNALVESIVEFLKFNTTYSSYKYTSGIPLKLAEEVCRMFSSKGYHAKIVFFCDGRSSYQSFHISKNYLDETRARMVYSESY